MYKIYDFEKGRGFMPDFILFLKTKDKKETNRKSSYKQELFYRIFIELKGNHLIEHDKWKEDFLLDIHNRHGETKMLKVENSYYRLIGLPFFNLGEKQKDFNNKFNKIVLKSDN